MPKPRKPTGNETSRWSKMKRQGVEPSFPDIEYGQYLIEILGEVGPAVSSGMGLSPISFTEIDAWARLMKVPIRGWEVRAVKELSGVYLEQHSKSETTACPCPLPAKERPKVDVSASIRRFADAHNAKLEERYGHRRPEI